MFDVLQAQSEVVSALFRDRREYMDPLIYTRDQENLETVEFTRRTYSEEGDNCCIDGKCFGHRLLGFGSATELYYTIHLRILTHATSFCF